MLKKLSRRLRLASEEWDAGFRKNIDDFRIRADNDAFRRTAYGGTIELSEEIRALSWDEQIQILFRISHWQPPQSRNREDDFGRAIEDRHDVRWFLWEGGFLVRFYIDVYERGSHPPIPAKAPYRREETTRVLRVMLDKIRVPGAS